MIAAVQVAQPGHVADTHKLLLTISAMVLPKRQRPQRDRERAEGVRHKARQLSLWLPLLLVVGLVQHGLHEVLARRRRGVLPGVLKVSSILISTLENLDLSYFVCRKNA